MTVKLKMAVGEGIGRITAINLPTELDAGESIVGSVTIINDGADDAMALIIIAEWSVTAYGGVFNLASGQSNDMSIPAGLILMPNQDAVMTIYACHAQLGGEWILDGVEYMVDEVQTH